MAVCADGSEPADSPSEPWTLVVVPDTQQVTYRYPDVLAAQSEWLAAQAEAGTVQLVAHLGDVTEWNSTAEWQRARQSFGGIAGVVPFAVAPGNHDYNPDLTRQSGLNQLFSPDELMTHPGFGGLFEADSTDNSFWLVEAGGESWLVLALEFGPRDAVLDWARNLAAEFSQRQVIIVTHAYLYSDGTRYDWAQEGTSQRWNPHSYPEARFPEVNDGQEMWEKLIAPSPNIRLVLSGHVKGDVGIARLSSENGCGTRVHQLMADFQSWPQGGAGYMPVLTFHGDRIEVETYSPYLDKNLTEPRFEFTLPRP